MMLLMVRTKLEPNAMVDPMVTYNMKELETFRAQVTLTLAMRQEGDEE